MKQITLCFFGNGYTEPYNCQVDLAPEDRMLIPTLGDEFDLPGMEVSQIVRSRSFCYSEGRILIILNYDKTRASNFKTSTHGNVEEK
jgi:hypothetical protein